MADGIIEFPKIACLCCTYKRPKPLAESIECFLRQEYPEDKKELVIVDDAGQYAPDICDAWENIKLITTKERYLTLGDKRNASAQFASSDVEVFAIWDDDDIYLPWHLKQIAEVIMKGAEWSKPKFVWIDKRKFLNLKKTNGLFHASWGITKEAFYKVGGYPSMQSGQDQALGRRLKNHNIKAESPTGIPTFIYRWCTCPGVKHFSALNRQTGYESLGKLKSPFINEIKPFWSKDWTEMAIKAAKKETLLKGENNGF